LAASAIVGVAPAIHSAEPVAVTNNTKSKNPVAEIGAIVDRSLAKNPYYFPGALISRSDVSPICEKLLEQGLTDAEDQEDLYASVLSDQAPLVKRLKTPAGRAFMKKIVTDKTAFDRLERLSWTVDGRKLLESFVSAKDGYERFQKLKTPADLAKVSKQLAADSHTPDFNLPTGHILTADALVQKLQELRAGRDNPPVTDEAAAAR
jgi:hypothetical protein